MKRNVVVSLALVAGGIALVVTAFRPWEAIQPYYDLGLGFGRAAGAFDVFGGAVLIGLGLVRPEGWRGRLAVLALSATLTLNVASALHDMPGDKDPAFAEAGFHVVVTPDPWVALAGAIVALCGAVLDFQSGAKHHAVTVP